ncbi:DNA polymerase [Occallatibacter savannae]|uniref:DNA polymerase n=1 Tax=Occallatibacter savannae TaxID=1002691 RepID=UPI000D686E19|nr:DNA polymerase [Occallatibacter savannae]
MSFLQLGWQMPRRILDLFIEYRHLNNEAYRLQEMKSKKAFGLLAAASRYGIHLESEDYKQEMRDLILRAHPYTAEEQQRILHYCEMDVRETAALAEAMWREIPDLRAAVFRGSSARGFSWARMIGIPLDVDLLERLNRRWSGVSAALTNQVKQDFPIFHEGSADIAPSLWKEFLDRLGWIEKWPHTRGSKKKGGGAKRLPKRDEKTLRAMANVHPELASLHAYLCMRNSTKLGLKFPVGSDGRSRVHFWDYGTVTSRCSPSSSQFVIQGGSPAFRHLVKPRENEVLIQIDWASQEIWIAAFLSGDRIMQEMLSKGDPYVAFGHLANLLPADATKKPENSPYWATDPNIAKQHTVIRNRLKAVALGVLYGKTAYTIAAEEGMTLDEARALLRIHRRLFKRFWNWITGVTSEALATRRISTRFGWTQQLLSRKEREAHLNEEGRVKSITNSLQNFPMQAHGAEMLRLAMTYAADLKVPVCAPLHDAIFAVAPVEEEQQVTDSLLEAMSRASMDVIGCLIPTEVEVIRFPNRFVPTKKPEAIETWNAMLKALERLESEEAIDERSVFEERSA